VGGQKASVHFIAFCPNPLKYTDPDGRSDEDIESANKVLDAMYEQGMRIYVSKENAEKLGLNFGKGENYIRNEEQLNGLKTLTAGVSAGEKGYTLYYSDKSRTSYLSSGTLEYYESEYNPGFPMFGGGKNYGLSDGGYQTAFNVIMVGRMAVSLFQSSGLQIFAKAGKGWHIGVETSGKMNIIHLGKSPRYGTHLALGAKAPFFADIHIYFQKTLPFFKLWRPK
jgi:hypothetical protein